MTIYGFKMKRGSYSDLKRSGEVIRAGEPVYLTDIKRMVVGDGVTQGYLLPKFLDDSKESYINILRNQYKGLNLTEFCKEEIADYGGNAWEWIHNERIKRNKFDGLAPWDYIPYEQQARAISDGTKTYNLPKKTMRARIAGIDTYFNYGYPSACPHHIDFITISDTIGVNIPWQTCDNNNGSSYSIYPWRTSVLYACLNGVDNRGTGYGGVELGFNASSGGVLQSMPQYLQDNIAMKRLFADSRKSDSGLLTESTSGDVDDVGKIWVPREVEILGFVCNTQQKDGLGINRSAYGSIQYDIFKHGNAKLDMGRVGVWTSSVAGGSSSRACNVNSYGYAGTIECAPAWSSAWAGFRLAA